MGILFWRKNDRKIDAFARSVADELFSFVSPEEADRHFSGAEPKKKKKQHNVENRIHGLILQLNDFSKENSLGIYGKARLQKQFSDRLIELGYDTGVTRKLVEAVLYQGIA